MAWACRWSTRFRCFLKLSIRRDGQVHEISFTHGVADAPLEIVGEYEGRSGTAVTFLPSTDTFTMVEFDFKTLEHRLRELAFLNSGVHILLADRRHPEPVDVELFYEGGLEAFVRYLDKSKAPVIETPITMISEKDGITVEVALQWNDSYHENVLCFTNNIPQRDGGTHLAGLRGALTRQVTGYANASGIAKKEKVELSGDDTREGPDLRALGESAGPQILVPDQGQTGVLRSAPRGREHRQRKARPVV
jgi:DNA gyrase subunit B